MKKKVLVIDLDNSLLKIDLFKETLGKSLLHQPWVFLKTVLFAFRNRAFAKIFISKKFKIKSHTLPFNDKLIDIITDYKNDQGYQIILATGTPHNYAKPIANFLGLFDKVISTDNHTNIVGINKLNSIKNEVEGEFIYAGDSKKDLPIWLHCKKAILIGNNRKILKQLKSSNVEIIDVIKQEKCFVKLLFKQLRIHQWSKNILLFVPALASHQLFIQSVFVNSLKGFLAFSLLASSIYIFNDILDIDYDRNHPEKKNRPIPAGDLSIFTVYSLLACCFMGAAYLSFNLGVLFLLVAAMYIMLNLLYSFKLKQIIIIDVILLMSFYVLRLIAGHVTNGILLSPWLLSFSMFLFFSLGLLKRYVDTLLIRKNNSLILTGRGYSIDDGNILMSLGVGSGQISALVLILYTGSDQVQQLWY